MKASLFLVVLLCVTFAVAGEGPDTSHFAYDPKFPLDIKELGLQEREGIKLRDLSYASPRGGRVLAYLVEPSGKGPFPAILYGHWCMPGSPQKNRTEFLPEALALAHAGVISLLIDHVIVRPGFVQDKTPLNEQQVEVLRQQVIDVRRGADLLLQRRDVDGKRLAYVGHSCGGDIGGILSGVDKRFRAFVIMAGSLSDEVDRASKSYQEYRQMVGPEKFDAFVRKFSWTDAGLYVRHAAPATVFMQYATREPFITPEMARQYFARVSEPKKFRLYDAEHSLNTEATRDRIAFLEEQLAFPPLDREVVDAIPIPYQPPEWGHPKRTQDNGNEKKDTSSK